MDDEGREGIVRLDGLHPPDVLLWSRRISKQHLADRSSSAPMKHVTECMMLTVSERKLDRHAIGSQLYWLKASRHAIQQQPQATASKNSSSIKQLYNQHDRRRSGCYGG
jgi:hypothetical protein